MITTLSFLVGALSIMAITLHLRISALEDPEETGNPRKDDRKQPITREELHNEVRSWEKSLRNTDEIARQHKAAFAQDIQETKEAIKEINIRLDALYSLLSINVTDKGGEINDTEINK